MISEERLKKSTFSLLLCFPVCVNETKTRKKASRASHLCREVVKDEIR